MILVLKRIVLTFFLNLLSPLWDLNEVICIFSANIDFQLAPGARQHKYQISRSRLPLLFTRVYQRTWVTLEQKGKTHAPCKSEAESDRWQFVADWLKSDEGLRTIGDQNHIGQLQVSRSGGGGYRALECTMKNYILCRCSSVAGAVALLWSILYKLQQNVPQSVGRHSVLHTYMAGITYSRRTPQKIYRASQCVTSTALWRTQEPSSSSLAPFTTAVNYSDSIHVIRSLIIV